MRIEIKIEGRKTTEELDGKTKEINTAFMMKHFIVQSLIAYMEE